MAARSNEETWTLLPDGSVITVSCANHPHAERYIPSTGSWISAGSTPVELVQASSIEIGPAVLLPDGRVFTVGATGRTEPTDPACCRPRLRWRLVVVDEPKRFGLVPL